MMGQELEHWKHYFQVTRENKKTKKKPKMYGNCKNYENIWNLFQPAIFCLQAEFCIKYAYPCRSLLWVSDTYINTNIVKYYKISGAILYGGWYIS